MDEQMVVPPSFIKTKLTELFNSQFSKVVSDTIDSEIKQFQTHFGEVDEAKDKFYASLSEAKHTDYPEPIDYNGPFKFCGKCIHCKLQDFLPDLHDNNKYSLELLDKALAIIIPQIPHENSEELMSNEYFYLCSLLPFHG